MTRSIILAANWKMNGLQAHLGFAEELKAALSDGALQDTTADVVVCPPATLLADMARAFAGSRVQVGGQTCHPEPSGAYTGEISPAMLVDAGAKLVILGHSERREMGETDADVQLRVVAALKAGLTPIVCVGESLEVRERGDALATVARQMIASLPAAAPDHPVIVAYEPIWAIGTGKTAAPEDAQAMHAHLRKTLTGAWGASAADGVSILYGGSMKPENARDLLALPDIDGGLIGGAGLKADSFSAIIAAA